MVYNPPFCRKNSGYRRLNIPSKSASCHGLSATFKIFQKVRLCTNNKNSCYLLHNRHQPKKYRTLANLINNSTASKVSTWNTYKSTKHGNRNCTAAFREPLVPRLFLPHRPRGTFDPERGVAAERLDIVSSTRKR